MNTLNRSVGLKGCQHCAYRLSSQREAAALLRDVIRTAHMRTIRGGGTLMEVRLTSETVIKLCLWEAGCEDCEHGEDYGDSVEADSQSGSMKRRKRLSRRKVPPATKILFVWDGHGP